MKKLMVFAKWAISYLKQEWDIEDYPLEYDQREVLGLEGKRWFVQPVGWFMMGMGETKAEALEDLREKLARRKEDGGELPRPGTEMPLEFSSTTEIRKYQRTMRTFVAAVLEMNPDHVMLTDESSLKDFSSVRDVRKMQEKTEELFGVDISDLEEGNIVDIIKRIEGREI